MSAYITGGWKLSGLNANYKLTDQKVRTYLDRSELLIRAIAGDEKAKTKLLESGSKDMKDTIVYTTALAWAPFGVSQNSQFLRPTVNGRIAFSLRLLEKLQRPSSR